MKKLLTLAALLGAATLSYGQGQLSFANTALTLVSTNSTVAGANTGPAAVAYGNYVYGLFIANSSVTSVSGFNDSAFTQALQSGAGIYASNTLASSGGRIQGGQPPIDGFAPGTTVSVLVRGWSANVGSTWALADQWYNNNSVAFTGWLGQSGVATGVVLGGGAIGIPSIFGASAGQIGGFSLNRIDPVPEPASLALVGLGAAAMLIFRRRK